MTDPFFKLLVLPFQAKLSGSPEFLPFEQTMCMLREGQRIQIERSPAVAPHAIGWTIFRRTPRKYVYDNEPLFRFERGARRSLRVRKAYAIHNASLTRKLAGTGSEPTCTGDGKYMEYPHVLYGTRRESNKKSHEQQKDHIWHQIFRFLNERLGGLGFK